MKCSRDIVKLNPTKDITNKEQCTKTELQPISYNTICKNFRDQVANLFRNDYLKEYVSVVMGIVFWNERNFYERTKKRSWSFRNDFVCFFIERTNFPKVLGTKRFILSNYFWAMVYFWTIDFFEKNISQFYWTNEFIEQIILMNERFSWTILQWENERNRWKMIDNFRNQQSPFVFEQLKNKRTKWVVKNRRTNEMKNIYKYEFEHLNILAWQHGEKTCFPTNSGRTRIKKYSRR